MKKALLIALVAAGFLMVGAPKSEARVFFNIGIGFPFAYYPYYPAYYGYPAYPGYGYYPYAYPGVHVYYNSFGPYYWYHGRRVYFRHRHW
jgi:hypothetical protein